jgi:hypothetical protein
MNHEPIAAAGVPAPAARPVAVDGGIFRPPSAVTEHARLTEGTADLWRELVHLCMETPT